MTKKVKDLLEAKKVAVEVKDEYPALETVQFHTGKSPDDEYVSLKTVDFHKKNNA